jgi:MFS-type transporter involved in bile tolerance (Atg22 family)
LLLFLFFLLSIAIYRLQVPTFLTLAEVAIRWVVFSSSFSVHPVSRSLFAKGVKPDEVNHVYSFVGLATVVGPFMGEIFFKRVEWKVGDELFLNYFFWHLMDHQT